MEYVGVILVAAAVFGLCFLVDKGFARLLRSQAQHKSGRAVRLSKKYGAGGVILAVLGIAGMLSRSSLLMTLGGGIVLAVGVGLCVYYLSYGIFYDDDSFLVSSFLRKNRVYAYGQICGQRLYCSYGQTVIEIYLDDGKTVQLQSAMDGAYPFLDHAFSAWCTEKQLDPEGCDFHDSHSSRWFPEMEDI